MLYNFKDKALMGIEKTTFLPKKEKKNTILTVF